MVSDETSDKHTGWRTSSYDATGSCFTKASIDAVQGRERKVRKRVCADAGERNRTSENTRMQKNRALELLHA